jgi:hypothetical protein
MGLLFQGYSENGFWKIDAYVSVGDITSNEKVKFIIDPGSGTTILSPYTAKRIGINFNTLPYTRECTLHGAGECNAKDLTDTSIIFDVGHGINGLMVGCPKISVPDSKEYKFDINLMGQDILKHFNVILCSKTKEPN